MPGHNHTQPTHTHCEVLLQMFSSDITEAFLLLYFDFRSSRLPDFLLVLRVTLHFWFVATKSESCICIYCTVNLPAYNLLKLKNVFLCADNSWSLSEKRKRFCNFAPSLLTHFTLFHQKQSFILGIMSI